MKQFLLLLFLPILVQAYGPVQNDRNYQVQMDLTKVVDSKIKVTVVVPVLEQDDAVYSMPKMIPGTYKIYNYGQFVHELKALDSKGNLLKVEVLNENQWKIEKAYELYKIEYWVSDSYNQSGSRIFAPAGTAIAEDAFLLNNFGFIGYLEGKKKVPFQLEIKKAKTLYGATSLEVENRSDTIDNFSARDYFDLHDCPILYCMPDTASLTVAGVPIEISVYSKEGKIHASELREGLKPVFEAAARYLGGNLPADRYTVLVYGLSLRKAMSGIGALEHNTSTVVTTPDLDAKMFEKYGMGDMIQMYRDIVAHEFFHIVTPLNIHSKEINDFDFINPTMSEHLWLYEGVTEYNAMISQTRGGVTSLEGFVTELKEKLELSRRYNEEIPFTQMSKYSLSFFTNQFNNVYAKGPIIGMATDLKLRSISEGEFGLIDLLEEMWQTYGADTFFVDDELFGLLAAKSYPQMEEFFVRHIASTEPLPLQELLAEVGIDYVPEQSVEKVSFGNMELRFSKERKALFVLSCDPSSPFIQELKIENGDVLLEINGVKLEMHSAYQTIADIKSVLMKGDAVEFIIEREVADDKWKRLKLKAHATTQMETEFDIISINENLTDKQRKLRQFWINN